MAVKIRDKQNIISIIVMLWPFYSRFVPDVPFEKLKLLSDSQIESIDFLLFSSVPASMGLVDHFIFTKGL